MAILAAMVLPADGGKWRARQAICARNLRSVDNSFVAWSDRHQGKLPMQTPQKDGGTQEEIENGSAVIHFQILTNSGLEFSYRDIVTRSENGKSFNGVNCYTNHGIEIRNLICPSDVERRKAFYSVTNISELADTNISYFVGLDSSLKNSKTILAGDRNLQIDNRPAKPGLLTINANSSVSWTTDLHFSKSASHSGGNILFADGHVEFLKPTALDSAFHEENLATNRLAIP